MLYANLTNNEWLIVWGNWKIYNNCLKSYFELVPSNPPGAINKFNALIYLHKIKIPFNLRLKFKIDNLLNKNSSGICGIAFEIKDGNNFYVTYVKITNKKHSLILSRAYGISKKDKRSKNYNFQKIAENNLYNITQKKWHILEIYRKKNNVVIKIDYKNILINKNIKVITTFGRICLITYNSVCYFKRLDIYSNQKIDLYFNKSSTKIKQIYIQHNLNRFHNPSFGP